MQTFTCGAWLALAVVHLSPAVAFAAPRLVERLYGVPPTGVMGILLVHRAVLFLAVLVATLVAAFDPGSRRLASLVTGISLVGFLFVYLRAGGPAGPLRKIAWVDVVALAPLAFVTYDAWTAAPA